MATTCPSCEAPDLEVDEYELEEGEIVTCPECGVNLEVTGISPVEFEVLAEGDDEDEDDEDEDEDDDDEDDDEGSGDEDGDVREDADE